MPIFGYSFVNKEKERRRFSKLHANMISNSNYFFQQAYNTKELLEQGSASAIQNYHGKKFIKKYKDRFDGFAGLSAMQAFFVELASLTQLNLLYRETEHHPFPLLVDFSLDRLEITQSFCGKNFRTALVKPKIPNMLDQIDTIVERLKQANVMHLDIVENGKNLNFDADGRIYLIDFDIAAVRNCVYGLNHARKHSQYIRNGGFDYIRKQLIKIVNSSCKC